MKKKKKSSRVFGSRTKEEAAKEAEFKEQLNVFFPDITINFVYHDIKIGGKVSQKIKDEGCFGYHMRESILVDNKSIKIAWLPHVKDMPSSYIKMIVERVVDTLTEVADEYNITGNIGASHC